MNSREGKPRISIGMPVFNGEEHIKDALDSIVSQTYQDFELIISDNASTDRTSEICQAYAIRDDRIRYHRNPVNLGAARNFNRVFELSRGGHFKWAAHDDTIAPEFLSKCMAALDRDPSVVLCQSKVRYMDGRGRPMKVSPAATNAILTVARYASSSSPHLRFGKLLSFRHPVLNIFGVIRSRALRMTSLMGSYVGSDRNLLAEIGLIGRMTQIPEYLFHKRIHSQAYAERFRTFPGSRDSLGWWDPQHAKRAAPGAVLARNILEYFRSVRRAPLDRPERASCYAQIGAWFLMEGWIYACLDVLGNILSEWGMWKEFISDWRSLRQRGFAE